MRKEGRQIFFGCLLLVLFFVFVFVISYESTKSLPSGNVKLSSIPDLPNSYAAC
jgi:hypothetical protein